MIGLFKRRTYSKSSLYQITLVEVRFPYPGLHRNGCLADPHLHANELKPPISTVWTDKLKAAYADMKCMVDTSTPPAGFRELHLFSGVEISVQGCLHLLALFDPTATIQTISDLLNGV